jgi:cohesin domain-containing protein
VSCTPTTDQSGNLTCAGFLPGTYTACVKHSHTLQNCRGVTLVDGPNTVNFGTLLEGDANNDNCLLLVDFSILATAFGKCTGDSGFDARADFDGSGCVLLVDFSLLATNFGRCGPLMPFPVSATARPAVRAVAGDARGGGAVSRVALGIAAPRRVRAGDLFEVELQVEAGQQPVDAAAAYVNFDPRMLQVEGVTAGGRFEVELSRTADNAAGAVEYAAATLGDFPAGTFRLATIRFRALHAGATRLVLNRSAPRQSDATFGGASVLGPQQPAIVAIAKRLRHRPLLDRRLDRLRPH